MKGTLTVAETGRATWQGRNGGDLRIDDHMVVGSLSIFAIVSGSQLLPWLHKDRACETHGSITFAEKSTMEKAP